MGGGCSDFFAYDPILYDWSDPLATTRFPQNDGSSITANDNYGRYLWAIFGQDNPLEWDYYEVDNNEWHPKNNDIPLPLGPGASITGRPHYRRFWLVIGGERDNFYTHGAEDEEGPQSHQTMEISPKSRILSDREKISIQFSTDFNSRARIQVYDLSGKLVKILFSGNVERGNHSVSWDKTDKLGQNVTSGIYFITIDKGNSIERFKTVISK